MSQNGNRTASPDDSRPQSPVSVISRFSFEENGDSNNGESPHPGRDSKPSRQSSISASSQPSTNHIGLARPLSAAVISSNDRFASSVTPDLAKGNVLESTEQIYSVKVPTVSERHRDHNEIPTDEERARSMWTPFCLWRTTLIGFMLVFILLLTVVIILYHLSNLYHGLSTQIPSNHYSWNYGPTAVFAILLCLWRQVDYYCKTLLPWKEMRIRPATTDRSMLLDYISLDPVNGFLAAWNNRHWAVVATNLGLCILILITIFSTGLLVLSPTSGTSHSTELTATNQFGAYNGPPFHSLPATPWYTYYGVLENGLGFPEGTLNDVAFQSLEPAGDVSRDEIINTNVSAFFPQLDCEVADVYHSLTTTVSATAPGPALGIVLDGASCTAANSKSLCDPQAQDCPSQAFIYEVFTLNGILSNNDCQIAPDDAYIFFVIGDVRYQQNASSGTPPSQEVSIANISGLICKPTYTINSAHLVLDPALNGTLAGANISRVDKSPGTLQSGFTNSNLTSAWYETLNAIGPLYNSDTDVYEALFHFMAAANNHSSIEALFDPSVQSAAATIVFSAVMTQFAREYLMAPANITIDGQVSYDENRLHVRALSVWLIAVGLVLLICAAIVVFLYKPHNVVPRNPNSLAAMSKIITSSESFQNLLQCTGHLPDEALRQHLSSSSYQTNASPSRGSFVIHPQEASSWPLPPSRLSKILHTSVKTPSQNAKYHCGYSNSAPPNSSESRWWRPLTVRLSFWITTLALPVVTIVVLEVIQHYSNKHDGLVDSAYALASATALSYYLPAALMMVISIMFNSLNSTLMIFVPYSTLVKGNSPARRNIMSSYLGKIPILGLIEAVIVRHWTVCFSTTAAILGSILVIVVPGLYISNAGPGSSGVYVHQMDQFNLNWTNSANNDSNAGTMFALVEKNSTPYPRFTYDELALPTIQISDKAGAAHDVLQVRLGATRASLNCTVVPSPSITVSIITLGSGGQVNVTVQAPLPASCPFGGSGGNSPAITFDNTFQISLLNSTAYGGILLDLHDAPSSGDNLGFQSYGNSTGSSEADNPPGCPSLGFIFGYITVGDDINFNATALMCSQLAEEVQTDTHFLLPSMDLDPRNPPVPDEGTAKYLVNQTGALSYRIQGAFDSEVTAYNGTNSPQSGSPTMLDPFFQALLYDQEHIDPTSLVGPANVDSLINATNHVYRKYMAQAFNSNMRYNLSSADRTTVRGTVVTPNQSRLVQDEASKIVLQVLLATMVLCGVAAHLLADTKRVLPHSPTSIAGVASLLERSELVDKSFVPVVPGRSEGMGAEEVGKKVVFQGMVFGLGWWGGTEEGKGRRFGIGVGKAEGRI